MQALTDYMLSQSNSTSRVQHSNHLLSATDSLKQLLIRQAVSGELLRDLGPILHHQFSPGIDTEIGGAILLQEPGHLRWLEQESLETIRVRKIISDFSQFQNIESARLLLDYVEEWFADALKFESQFAVSRLDVVALMLGAFISHGKKLWSDERDLIIDTARDMLYASYYFSIEALQKNDGELLGVFHVHHNNAPPSDIDLDCSRQLSIPLVVLSASPNTCHNSVNLFLIQNGEVELIPLTRETKSREPEAKPAD